MANKKFTALLRPSNMAKKLRQHQGDVSTGSKAKILATRSILGKVVTFYENGEHKVRQKGITDEEQFNSEILRFAHASLLIAGPVGSKERIWIDATKNPVEIWLYNMPAEQFVKLADQKIKSGQVSRDFFVDQHPDNFQEALNHERNVRLS